MQEENKVAQAYDKLLARVKEICLRNNRDFSKVNILVVTKYATEEQIWQLLSERQVFAVGQSQLQDTLEKFSNTRLKDFKVKKFFIGHLQTNKAAKVLENFDLICSLDSLRLAEVLNKQADRLNKKVSCLVQIKLTDRQTQGGLEISQADSFIKQVKTLYPAIELRGLMAIAPQGTPAEIRAAFKKAKAVFDSHFKPQDYLSLGMSSDFEIALQEGSNLIRIGSAVFD
jgi:hypothetical protein